MKHVRFQSLTVATAIVVFGIILIASAQPPPPPPPTAAAGSTPPPPPRAAGSLNKNPTQPIPQEPTPTAKEQQFSSSVPESAIHNPTTSGSNPDQTLSSSIPHPVDDTKKPRLLRLALGPRDLEHVVEKHPTLLLAVADFNMAPRAEDYNNFYNKTAHVARILEHEYRLSKVRVVFTTTRHQSHNIDANTESIKIINQMLLRPKRPEYFSRERLEEEQHIAHEIQEARRHKYDADRHARIEEIGVEAAHEEVDEDDNEEARRWMGPILDRIHMEGTEGFVLVEHGRTTEVWDATKMHVHEIAQRVAAAASANLKILSADRIASFATASPREALVVVRKTCRTSRDLRKTLSPFAQFVAAKPEVFELLPEGTDVFVLARVATGMLPPGCKFVALDTIFKDTSLEAMRAARFHVVAIERAALQAAGERNPSMALHTPMLPLIAKLVVPVVVKATHAGQMAEYARSNCVVHLFHANINSVEIIPSDLRNRCVFVNDVEHDYHQKTIASFGFTNRQGGASEKLLVGVHYNGAKYSTFFEMKEIAKPSGGNIHQRREERRRKRDARKTARLELEDEERRRKYDAEDFEEEEEDEEDQQLHTNVRSRRSTASKSGKGTVLRTEDEPLLSDEEEEEREQEEDRKEREREREGRHHVERPVFNVDASLPHIFPYVSRVLAGKEKPVGRAPMPRHDDGVHLLTHHEIGDIDEDDFHRHVLGDHVKDSFVVVFPDGKCPTGCEAEKQLITDAFDIFIGPLIRDSLTLSFYNFSHSQPHRYLPKEISETTVPMLCMFPSVKKFLFFAHHRHRQSNARFYGGVDGNEEDSGHPEDTKWMPIVPGTTSIDEIKDFVASSRPHFQFAIRKRSKSRSKSMTKSHDEL